MSEQLSLLEWKASAVIVPFPLHRSHGATAGVARSMVNLETPKRTGRLNSLRSQTRKRLESLIGADRAEQAADDLIRMIRIQFAYCENTRLQKQEQVGAVIYSLTGRKLPPSQYGYSGGEANASVPRPEALARPEGTEYDAARAREGGAA